MLEFSCGLPFVRISYGLEFRVGAKHGLFLLQGGLTPLVCLQ